MTTFTAKAVDLVDALSNVLPHAGADDTLPMLCAVQVTVDADGTVTLAATDRYTLARVELFSGPPDSDIVPGSYVVPRAAAMEALKLAKAAKLGWLTLTQVDGNVTIAAPGTTATYQLIYGAEFPKWQSLLPDGDLVGTERFALGARHMAKFAKLLQNGRAIKNAAVTLEMRGATKVIDATCGQLGDSFRAIIMPVRLSDTKA